MTVSAISSPVIRVNGQVRVRPAVSASGSVQVTSKLLTVKQGKKTVAKNKTSVLLKAGTYSVSSTVNYKTYTVKGGKKQYSAVKKATKSQTLVVRSAIGFKTIASKTAPYGGKATIKPNVSAAKGVKIASKTLTVKQGKKTLVKNKPSAALKAGKYTVTTTAKYRIPTTAAGKTTWSGTYTATKTQALTIKAGKKPTRVAGTGSFNCPAGFPIKGNQSGIYHVPGGAFYARTNPEECFSNASAAVKAGYRASKR